MQLHRIAAIGWTVLIIAACSLPGADLPQLEIDFADKLAHFALFAGYGWLWMAAIDRPHRTRVLIVIASGVLLAIGSEIYQGFLPWERDPDVLDAIANTVGLVAAVGLFVARRRSH